MPPVASHDNRLAPTPCTEPPAATTLGVTAAAAGTSESGAAAEDTPVASITESSVSDTAGARPARVSAPIDRGVSDGDTGETNDGEAGTPGAGIPVFCRRDGAATPDAEAPERGPDADAPPPDSDDAAPEDTARPWRREGTPDFVDGAVVATDPSDPEPTDPADPAEPVVSANATGIAPTADPIPNATANTPTRPTKRAYPAGAACEPVTVRRLYSMDRIRPFCERR